MFYAKKQKKKEAELNSSRGPTNQTKRRENREKHMGHNSHETL